MRRLRGDLSVTWACRWHGLARTVGYHFVSIRLCGDTSERGLQTSRAGNIPEKKKKCTTVDSSSIFRIVDGHYYYSDRGALTMCGIVGLFLKDAALEPQLGALLTKMLSIMSDRGPDSAGFAVFGDAIPGTIKLTVRGPRDFDFPALIHKLKAAGITVSHCERDTHIVLRIPTGEEDVVRAAIASIPELSVVGSGRRMEIFKEVGQARSGRRTVSASRPWPAPTPSDTPGWRPSPQLRPMARTLSRPVPDQCLVHNGSLSNHNRCAAN